MVADAHPDPSDEDEARDLDPWPEDIRSGSHPAPPPEYEEAETWRRARAREKQAREDADRAWREALREYDRQLKEWRKEQKRRRKGR